MQFFCRLKTSWFFWCFFFERIEVRFPKTYIHVFSFQKIRCKNQTWVGVCDKFLRNTFVCKLIQSSQKSKIYIKLNFSRPPKFGCVYLHNQHDVSVFMMDWKLDWNFPHGFHWIFQLNIFLSFHILPTLLLDPLSKKTTFTHGTCWRLFYPLFSVFFSPETFLDRKMVHFHATNAFWMIWHCEPP